MAVNDVLGPWYKCQPGAWLQKSSKYLIIPPTWLRFRIWAKDWDFLCAINLLITCLWFSFLLLLLFWLYRLSSAFLGCPSVLPLAIFCSNNYVYFGSVGHQTVQAAIPILLLCPPYFWWVSLTTWPLLFWCLIIPAAIRGSGFIIESLTISPGLPRTATTALSIKLSVTITLSNGVSECIGSGVGEDCGISIAQHGLHYNSLSSSLWCPSRPFTSYSLRANMKQSSWLKFVILLTSFWKWSWEVKKYQSYSVNTLSP